MKFDVISKYKIKLVIIMIVHVTFNRRCRIYSGFYFLLAHWLPHFKYVKDKM